MAELNRRTSQDTASAVLAASLSNLSILAAAFSCAPTCPSCGKTAAHTSTRKAKSPQSTRRAPDGWGKCLSAFLFFHAPVLMQAVPTWPPQAGIPGDHASGTATETSSVGKASLKRHLRWLRGAATAVMVALGIAAVTSASPGHLPAVPAVRAAPGSTELGEATHGLSKPECLTDAQVPESRDNPDETKRVGLAVHTEEKNETNCSRYKIVS